MKTKLIYGIVSIVLILGSFMLSSYLINSKPIPKKSDKQTNIVYVKTDPVKITESSTNMTYRGRVTAFDNVALAAEVQGKLIQGDVRLKAGEHFRKGDVLIRIYSKDVEAALKSGKSSFLQTLSKILPDLRVDYANEFDKWNTFFNAIDIDKPLPELPAINSNKEKVFLAANNVLASYYTLQQQEINLSRYTIYAPFNGSFKSVSKEIGAVANPGTELATIIRSDKLEIIVPVFPSDLAWIQEGDQIKLSNLKNQDETAVVSRISPFVNEATQSVDVYLTYHKKNSNSFLQGEYVDAHFDGVSVSGQTIPREALVEDQFVYQIQDKKLIKTQVEVIRKLEDSFIISGLEEGELIVTESLASISNSAEYVAR